MQVSLHRPTRKRSQQNTPTKHAEAKWPKVSKLNCKSHVTKEKRDDIHDMLKFMSGEDKEIMAEIAGPKCITQKKRVLVKELEVEYDDTRRKKRIERTKIVNERRSKSCKQKESLETLRKRNADGKGSAKEQRSKRCKQNESQETLRKMNADGKGSAKEQRSKRCKQKESQETSRKRNAGGKGSAKEPKSKRCKQNETQETTRKGNTNEKGSGKESKSKRCKQK
ncbi:unnamed protein product [Owenia fusiformis]|uniref:Uncharacterized protein n=1 Tax=Owenia fusiformis TaxID=6347 RepID=A0A8S4MZX6_OWEFU|nr:unnamed protein product [Owenia fusiformis]